MVADDLLRVLQKGPQGEADYEIAGWLIDQGLAAGRRGPPSKGRDSYGKITQLVWVGMTPAGRLWLEESARADLDEAKIIGEKQANAATEELHQKTLESIAEAITRLPKPQPNLVKLAWVVFASAVFAMAAYLFKTHLGIPL